MRPTTSFGSDNVRAVQFWAVFDYETHSCGRSPRFRFVYTGPGLSNTRIPLWGLIQQQRLALTRDSSPEGASDLSGAEARTTTTEDGYLALLDVLGFSALVTADRGIQDLHRYLECLQRILQPGQSGINYVVFSDSIVLTLAGTESHNLLQLSRACSRLMTDLIKQEIPIRGAISCGKIVRSVIEGSVFVAGKPIVEAYRYEQLQDWVGIMLTPSTLRQARDVDFAKICTLGAFGAPDFSNLDSFAWPACIQHAQHIPFHAAPGAIGESFYDGFAVIPGDGTTRPEAMLDAVEVTEERIDWLRSVAPSPAEQRKYAATSRWLSEIKGTLTSFAPNYLTWKRNRDDTAAELKRNWKEI